MSKLGAHVVYHAAETHHTVSKKTPLGGAETEQHGSVHHPECRSFAGLVTREHEPDAHAPKKDREASFDLVIFPPGRAPVHVERVKEGNDAGEATILG